jgi:hypothetical protein
MTGKHINKLPAPVGQLLFESHPHFEEARRHLPNLAPAFRKSEAFGLNN